MLRNCFILLWIGVFSVVDIGYAVEENQTENPSSDQVNSSYEGFRSNNYLIQSGDKLNIQVYHETDLTGIFAVDDTGSINYPLLGAVNVKGMTLDQVSRLLTEKLRRDFVVNPKVQVSYGKSLNKSVIIFGQVGRPGNYDFTPDLTLVRLISQAGGFTGVADPKHVKIVRSQKDGSKKSIQVNVKRILDGKDEDVDIESGDLIVVPESLF